MKLFILVTAFVFLTPEVYGKRQDPTAEINQAPSKFLEGSTVEVKVNGMVCSFCVNSIKRKFKKVKQVKEVDVDLDSKIVTVKLKKGKTLTQKKLRKLIRGSGYKVVEFLPQKSFGAPKGLDAG